mmetsp:Transcript_13228/g.26414  ORF Transcript_13228/g.26414 Transcript_13228/m.26414 type:complete len:249 (-) Transcript_13228:125-871(-)
MYSVETARLPPPVDHGRSLTTTSLNPNRPSSLRTSGSKSKTRVRPALAPHPPICLTIATRPAVVVEPRTRRRGGPSVGAAVRTSRADSRRAARIVASSPPGVMWTTTNRSATECRRWMARAEAATLAARTDTIKRGISSPPAAAAPDRRDARPIARQYASASSTSTPDRERLYRRTNPSFATVNFAGRLPRDDPTTASSLSNAAVPVGRGGDGAGKQHRRMANIMRPARIPVAAITIRSSTSISPATS